MTVGELQFWVRIIMHMLPMRIIAIIMQLSDLTIRISSTLLSEFNAIICPLSGFVNT